MSKQDILIRMEDGVFSFRVAGILIQDGKVLLQRQVGDPGYAFLGGHVNFGETSEEALVREFKEELGADILPQRLLWIGENFFPWGGKDCHQICLYYLVNLGEGARIPLDGSWMRDELEDTVVDLELCWVDLASLKQVVVYEIIAQEKLVNLSDHIEQFIYKE